MTARQLDNFDDIVIKDVSHRHQESSSTGNIVQHLYSHVTGGSQSNVSVAKLVSTDQWNISLSTLTRRLNANTIPLAASNSAISATSNNTILRNNVHVSGNVFTNAVSASAAKFSGPFRLDNSATGSAIAPLVLSNSSSLVTSGAVFNAIQQPPSSGQNYPTITRLGKLTSLQVNGNIVVSGGTLAVSTLDNAVHMQPQSFLNTNATWNSATTPTSGWASVAYGNNVFVAVAFAGPDSRLMISSDGITWFPRTIPSGGTTSTWNSVTYGTPNGNPLFVAVASTGTNRVMTSPDGLNWTLRTCTAREWIDVTFGNGFFVAIAFRGAGTKVMRSSTGITWTDHDAAAPLEENQWNSIAFGDGVFVAVSSAIGTWSRIMTSTDEGLSWTFSNSSSVNSQFGSIAFGNGAFVAVAYSAMDSFILISTDGGTTWTGSDPPEDSQWQGVTFGDGVFVAVASGVQEGTGNRAMYSEDGMTWTLAETPITDNQWNDCVYGNGRFVAVASTGTGDRAMAWTRVAGSQGVLVTGNAVFGIFGNGNLDLHVSNETIAFANTNVRVSSTSTSLVFDANAYVFTGSPYNSQNNVSRGTTKHLAYRLFPALVGVDQSRREYGMSQRFWSGKVPDTNGAYTLSCHGNGPYPLYGTYTVSYATKAGTFEHERAMCMRGSTASQGQTNTVTWRTLSAVSSNTAGLSVAFGNSSWLPTITFTNTTAFHAYFIVDATVFDDDAVFTAPGAS